METTLNDGPTKTQPTQGQSPLPGPPATSTQSTCSYPQTPQMPAPIPGSSSTTKVPPRSSHHLYPSTHATRLTVTLREFLRTSILCINSLNNNYHSLVYQMQTLRFCCIARPLLLAKSAFWHNSSSQEVYQLGPGVRVGSGQTIGDEHKRIVLLRWLANVEYIVSFWSSVKWLICCVENPVLITTGTLLHVPYFAFHSSLSSWLTDHSSGFMSSLQCSLPC